MKYIGTSGFLYQNWVGEFYPPDLPKYRYFDYYVKFFNSLELNSTFYKFPTISSIRSWKYKLKKYDFKLSIKANRIITHFSKLKNFDKLKEFIELISILEDRLGAILFQLPPSLRFDENLLKDFINHLDNKKYAIEFRNKSWYKDKTYEILKSKNIALVWHDFNQEFIFEKTASFSYVRFHGFSGKYKGSSPDDILKEVAKKLQELSFIYFNNTLDNSAVKDALKMTNIVKNSF